MPKGSKKNVPKLKITKLSTKDYESKSTHIESTIRATAPTSATARNHHKRKYAQHPITSLPILETEAGTTEIPGKASKHLRQSSLILTGNRSGPMTSDRPEVNRWNQSEIVGIYDGNKPFENIQRI